MIHLFYANRPYRCLSNSRPFDLARILVAWTYVAKRRIHALYLLSATEALALHLRLDDLTCVSRSSMCRNLGLYPPVGRWTIAANWFHQYRAQLILMVNASWRDAPGNI